MPSAVLAPPPDDFTPLAEPPAVLRRASRPVLVLPDAPAEARWRSLEATLRTFLGALDHPHWTAWRDEAHERLLEVTGAKMVVLSVPIEGSPALQWRAPHLPDAARAWLAAHGAREMGALLARVQDDVADEDALERAGLAESALRRELLEPNGMAGITLAQVEFGGAAPAYVLLADAARRSDETRLERVTLLRTVLPAFGAGIAAWVREGARRAGIARMLDAMAGAVLLYDAQGELMHANAEGTRLTSGASDGERVKGEAQRMAWTLTASARRGRGIAEETVEREVRGTGRSFRLTAVLAPAALLGRELGVLVTVTGGTEKPLTDADLAERYGLTARETEVARLLAEGLSNQELAEKLGVSFFTARNHVERVLGKLSVQNRARVAALLRGGSAAE